MEDFAALANRYGIKLWPYIAYTPAWAGAEGAQHGVDSNKSPANFQDWCNFVYQLAVRAADPDAQVLLGGLTFPDHDWLEGPAGVGYARYYDILPFHAYPETWTEPEVIVENYLDVEYYQRFLPEIRQGGEGEPIWINEMGYLTASGRSEIR